MLMALVVARGGRGRCSSYNFHQREIGREGRAYEAGRMSSSDGSPGKVSSTCDTYTSTPVSLRLLFLFCCSSLFSFYVCLLLLFLLSLCFCPPVCLSVSVSCSSFTISVIFPDAQYVGQIFLRRLPHISWLIPETAASLADLFPHSIFPSHSGLVSSS